MRSSLPSDTIVALASGAGRAGVAVLRLSGPHTGEALRHLTNGTALPLARTAVRRRFVDPETGDGLDDGLMLWFPAPASFTGEDVGEIHCHGGRAVIEGILAVLCACPGVRPAEAGEFSRRAFENGKFDLTQAEAIADLVDAETEAQRRQALRQMDGALARLLDGWRTDLIRASAHLEAYIDFPDEPIPDSLDRSVRGEIEDLAERLKSFLDDGRRGERLRDGVHIAVIGPPNAGKSSLVNALAQREAAIVSATAGTTRDVVEVHLDLGGYPVILADTAGLREAAEEIEAEGIRRALARAEHADIRLVVVDGATWPTVDAQALSLVDERSLLVLNKLDLCPAGAEGLPELAVSVKSGVGLDRLTAEVTALVAARFETGAAPVLTRARHRAAVEDCRMALLRALSAPHLELMAEDLRLAARALGRVTGRVAVDELLDVIFRDFCIGK